MHRDFREDGDDLLLRGQICTLLELEVADGSAQREVAIDSAKIDEATSSTDARLLAFVLRLVVEGERLRTTFDPQDGPGVSGVTLKELVFAFGQLAVVWTYDVDLVVGDDAHRSGAA